MPSFASPLFLLTLLHHVQAQKIWPILSNPTFGWTPNITNAVRDDILEFHFLALNHSVVAGDLNGKACTPAKDGGFYSGFYPVSDGENPVVFLVKVTGPDPVVFYDPNNCDKRFVGGVNIDPSALESYACAAAKVGPTAAGVPPAPFGGETSSRPTQAPAAPTPAIESKPSPYGPPGTTAPAPNTPSVTPAVSSPTPSPADTGTPSVDTVPPSTSTQGPAPSEIPPSADGAGRMGAGTALTMAMGLIGVFGIQFW